MKNRFCRMGKSLLSAVILLSALGLTYACHDDYDLDETSPSFLGESIYDELLNSQDRKFTTVIRLIDDLDQADVLSKTGSKTLFVADDDAFAKFFANNDLTDGNGNMITSYDQLSTNQKRLLLNGSMLDNASVLEMLTTIEGPVKNLCLRQISSASATDSIPYWAASDLPDNLNEGQLDEDGDVENADNRFWDYYRKHTEGIYMALDGTDPLMTHFLEANLNENNITHGDISFVLNLDGTENEWSDSDTENRSYVYGCKIIEQDITCLNGYYNVLDTVLVAPPNMAEVIRTNGSTNYFSAMLDRFSAPYYDADLTTDYKALHTISADSIFKKIYISSRSALGSITTGPDDESLGDFPFLSYDPGWNAYNVSGITKEEDMAAMFVPSDAAMENYFLNGGGTVLIERYGTKDNTAENLLYNLYQIPLNIIEPLISNLMKDSFNESVPSKYLTIMNDAQDPMFDSSSYPTVDDFKAAIDKVILANNGVVYVMNTVISPATYASVMAPVLYDEDTQVVNTVIHADDAYTTDNYAYAPLRKFYSTYLLAMQSTFTFFVPVDDGLINYGYVDPIGWANTSLKNYYRYWTFEPQDITVDTSDGYYLAVRARAYAFDYDTPLAGTSGTSRAGVNSIANQDLTTEYGVTKKNLLCEMIDQHLIVHDNDDAEGVRSSKNYYLSRNGAPVHIKTRTSSSDGIGMVVEGGLQVEINSDDNSENDILPTVIKSYDMTRETNDYGNGMTYYLDRPLQASLNTVYGVMGSTEDFKDFYDLCCSLHSTNGVDLITQLFYDSEEDDDVNQVLSKYYIFAPNESSSTTTGARYTARSMRLVRFFNAYRYTIYVPSAAAIENARAKGLMTIDEIYDYIEANSDEDGNIDEDAKVKAQAMVTTLVNFIKYHFVDQSLFVDDVTAETFCSSNTAEDGGGFIKVTVNQTPGAIDITDALGNNHKVDTDRAYNVMARDFELNAAAASARSISNSSYVTLHSIGDDYMLYADEVANRFDSAWSSVAKAKAFVKKYQPQY